MIMVVCGPIPTPMHSMPHTALFSDAQQLKATYSKKPSWLSLLIFHFPCLFSGPFLLFMMLSGPGTMFLLPLFLPRHMTSYRLQIREQNTVRSANLERFVTEQVTELSSLYHMEQSSLFSCGDRGRGLAYHPCSFYTGSRGFIPHLVFSVCQSALQTRSRLRKRSKSSFSTLGFLEDSRMF